MKKRFDKRYITWYFEGIIPLNLLSEKEKEEVRRRNRLYKRRYRMRKRQERYWHTLPERIKKYSEETKKILEEVIPAITDLYDKFKSISNLKKN